MLLQPSSPKIRARHDLVSMDMGSLGRLCSAMTRCFRTSVIPSEKDMIRKKRCPLPGEYVQVLNLSYFCSPDVSALKVHLRKCQHYKPPTSCPTEAMNFPIVFFVWRWNDPIWDCLKARFLAKYKGHQFYYDYAKSTSPLTLGPTSATSKVKHPQGMKRNTVVAHLV